MLGGRAVLIALLSSVLLTVVPVRALAADVDSVTCTATGTMSISPGLVVLPTDESIGGSLSLSCNGLGDDTGTWSLSFSGTGTGAACTLQLDTTGTWGGSSPEGSVAGGSFNLFQPGPNGSVSLAGRIVTGNEVHWILVQLFTGVFSACPPGPTSSYSVSGIAHIADPPPDMDAVDCGATGSMTVSPGLTFVPAAEAFSGSLSLTCAGTGDDAGAWSLSFSGSGGSANCALSGSGTFSGSTPEGAVTGGSFSLTEPSPGAPLAISGTVLAAGETHTVTAVVGALFSPPCGPGTASTSAALVGTASLTE
jgi:hypothetical protein